MGRPFLVDNKIFYKLRRRYLESENMDLSLKFNFAIIIILCLIFIFFYWRYRCKRIKDMRKNNYN